MAMRKSPVDIQVNENGEIFGHLDGASAKLTVNEVSRLATKAAKAVDMVKARKAGAAVKSFKASALKPRAATVKPVRAKAKTRARKSRKAA